MLGLSIGQYIKIFCVNGLIEAGNLIEISPDYLKIKLLDKSIFILNNIGKNLIAVKVINEKIHRSIDIEKNNDVYIGNEFIEENIGSEYEKDEGLRAKKLADLHKIRAAAERSLARDKLTTSIVPAALPEVAFGTPNFSKSVYKHPPKKTR